MRSLVVVAALLVGCDRHAAPPAPQPVSPSPSASAAAAQDPAQGEPCGPLGCAQFASPREAFLAAVAGDARVVAVGEAHAQRGATAPSAAKRFTDDLLPLLAGRASDLLVELMMP